MKSYDYAKRRGARTVSWSTFASYAAQLTVALEQAGVEMIVGVARAGLIPATTAACALRCELYPVRVTRRVDDRVQFEEPIWRVPVPSAVAGKAVAVVDEISDTGRTLALVSQSVRDLGARSVLSACLVRHSWTDPVPDIAVVVTDELIVFPWDRRVRVDKKWQLHPELAAALEAQGLSELPQ